MKKIRNKKLEFVLASMIEVIEFSIISLIGYYILGTTIEYIITILLTFFVTRMIIALMKYKNGHYKILSYFDRGWVQCFTWTSMLCFSLFLTKGMGILIGMLFTVFTSLVISNWANIEEIKLGKRPKSDLKPIYAWVRLNQNDKRLIDFEESLKRDNFYYTIYKEIFIKGSPWEYVCELLDIEYSSYITKYIYNIVGRLTATIYEIQELSINLQL